MASQKALQRELYGFVAWVVSAIAVGLYLLWVLVPSSVLEQHGALLPSKYWALALPAVSSCALLVLSSLLTALARMKTPEASDMCSFADSSFVDPSIRQHEAHDCVPLLADIAPDAVSRALHRD
jgi:hypothetical protein